MAQLQCLETIKSRSRTTAHILSSQVSFRLPPRRPPQDNKLYDIKVFEEEGSKVKIHYIGYDSKFDEWRSKEDVHLKKPDALITDFSPLTELACQIKKRLSPSRHDDPAVSLTVPITEECFSLLASRAEKTGQEYRLKAYENLVDLLGSRWHLRIANHIGDFSYAKLETIQFHLVKPRQLMEYEPDVVNGRITGFTPVYIEQCRSLAFKFVRCDGNSTQLATFVNY